jgi:CrcB protein
MNIQNIMLLVLAGGVGTLVRYSISTFFAAGSYTTLIINVSGSFLIGILFELFSFGLISDLTRLILITGFLGAYTTFSTFSLESIILLSSGAYLQALCYILLSNVGGIFAAFGGIRLVQTLFSFLKI